MPTTALKYNSFEYGSLVDEVNLDMIPETANTQKYGPALGYTIDRLQKNYESADEGSRSEMVRDYLREVIRFQHRNVTPQQMEEVNAFFGSESFQGIENLLVTSGLQAKDFGREEVVGLFGHALWEPLSSLDANTSPEQIKESREKAAENLDTALDGYCKSSDLFWITKEDADKKALPEKHDWSRKRMDGVVPNYGRIYDELTDIPSRVAYLVEIKKSMAASKLLNVPISEKEQQAYRQLEERFVAEYITGATEQVRNTVFDTLGKIEGDVIHRSIREYGKQKSGIDAKDTTLRNEKAMWLLSQTGAGMDQTAVSEVKAGILGTIAEDKALQKKGQTRMKQAAKQQLESGKLSKEEIRRYTEMSKVDAKNLKETLGNWTNQTGNYLVRAQRRTESSARIGSFQDAFGSGMPISSEDQQAAAESAKKVYRKLGSMEEKLQFIIDCQVNVQASEKVYANADTLNELPDELMEQFVGEYIIDKGPQTARKAFEMLGRLSAESTIRIRDTYKESLKEFASEGAVGVKKADYLMSRSTDGMRAGAIRYVEGRFRSALSGGCRTENEIAAGGKLSEQTTIAEYAVKLGITDPEKQQEFFRKSNAKPDDKMVDLISKGNPHIDKNFALNDLQHEFVKSTLDNWLYEGFDGTVKKTGFDQEGIKELDTVRKKLFTEIKEKDIERWVNVQAKDRIRKMDEEAGSVLLNDNKKKYDHTVGYEQYLRLHTGDDVRYQDTAAQTKALAKALAASMLQDSGAKFDIKRIHAFAGELEKDPAFKNATKDKEALKRALCDPGHVKLAQSEIFATEFLPAPESVNSYIDQMKQLSENLMSPKGRSPEYLAFYKAVKDIGDLQSTHDFSKEGDRLAAQKKLVSMNLNLTIAIQNYIFGKERVRTTAGGKERFNNAMDALAILSQGLPQKKGLTDKLVKHINDKRGVKEGSPTAIDLKNFGLDRAVAAKVKREENQAAAGKGKQA